MRDILVILMEGEFVMSDMDMNKWMCLTICRNIIFPDVFFQVLFTICLSALSIWDSGTPAGVKYSEVRNGLLAVKGVTAVHNLHIWALTMNQAVLTAHVAIGEMKHII